MKKRILLAVSLLSVCLLSACDVTQFTKTDNANETKETSEVNSETKKETESKDLAVSTGKYVDFDEALGDWTLIANEYDGVTYLAEDEYSEGTISVYKEDGKTRLDYIYAGGESSLEIYGRKLEEIQGSDYYLIIQKQNDYNTWQIEVKMPDPDTLEVRKTYMYEEGDNYTYYMYYKKSDSDLELAKYNYRYREEVTVSNVKEFYNAIGSNKKIILKAGTYNFSELDEKDMQNPNVNTASDYYEYPFDWGTKDQAYCTGIRNLIIEGEEGAEVEICTEDGFLSPLYFYSCSYITLRNLKIGHLVEPGYCSGSVVDFYYTDNVTIDNCRLYGSGTYGIEAYYSENYTVTNSDIYECTYGLMYLTGCYTMSFENTTFRDSEYMSMFYFEGGDVYFKNCNITGNDSGSNNYALIDAGNSWGNVYFENCSFTNNTYKSLYLGEVSFTNCNIE